ncbi:unnamed protein product [Prunus armeniaca]
MEETGGLERQAFKLSWYRNSSEGDELNSIIAKFWRSGDGEKRKIHWLSWNKFCQPKRGMEFAYETRFVGSSLHWAQILLIAGAVSLKLEQCLSTGPVGSWVMARQFQCGGIGGFQGPKLSVCSPLPHMILSKI